MVLCQQRKSDVMASFGHSARSSIYYQEGSLLRHQLNMLLNWKYGAAFTHPTKDTTSAFKVSGRDPCLGVFVVPPTSKKKI
jgi:hypothetical protein